MKKFIWGSAFIAVIIVYATVIGYSGKNAFAKAIEGCAETEARLKFSCYRKALEENYSHKPDAVIDLAKGNKISFAAGDKKSYAIFGTNCHTFYHALGDFVATHKNEKDIDGYLQYVPTSCTSGAVMGLYKRLALKDGFINDTITGFYKYCKKGIEHQCAHEIGHVLHDKYSYSILKVIDENSLNEYQLAQPERYRYETYEKFDLNSPFEDCKKILPKNEWPYCFTGIGHNLFLFSEFSNDNYQAVFNDCESLEGENEENCFAFLIYRIGINHVAPKVLSGKTAEAIKICDEIVRLTHRESMEKHCYLGFGGGIGLYVDSEYGSKEINDETLPEMRQEMLNFGKLCEYSKPDFIEDCLAGLMGTKYAKLYQSLGVFYDRVEELIPKLDSDFQVVG